MDGHLRLLVLSPCTALNRPLAGDAAVVAFWSVCIQLCQCCACKPSSSANQSKHSAFFFLCHLTCSAACLYVCQFWSSLLQIISVVKVSNLTPSGWIAKLKYPIILDLFYHRPYVASVVSFILVTLNFSFLLCLYLRASVRLSFYCPH